MLTLRLPVRMTPSGLGFHSPSTAPGPIDKDFFPSSRTITGDGWLASWSEEMMHLALTHLLVRRFFVLEREIKATASRAAVGRGENDILTRTKIREKELFELSPSGPSPVLFDTTTFTFLWRPLSWLGPLAMMIDVLNNVLECIYMQPFAVGSGLKSI